MGPPAEPWMPQLIPDGLGQLPRQERACSEKCLTQLIRLQAHMAMPLQPLQFEPEAWIELFA